MKKAKLVKQILKAARKKVRAGWCQLEPNILIAGQVQHCLYSAIVRSANEVLRAPIVSLSPFHPDRSTIIDWNDDGMRTQEEVIALLDKVIASC